jgi:hypothetical protein
MAKSNREDPLFFRLFYGFGNFEANLSGSSALIFRIYKDIFDHSPLEYPTKYWDLFLALIQ